MNKIFIEKIDEYKNTIEKEAIAGIATALSRLAPAIARATPKVTGNLTKAYNNFAKSGVGKKTLVGTGLGAGVGAMNYDASKDDGSFSKSRFGKMLGGAATGATLGFGTGLATKNLKPITPRGNMQNFTGGTPISSNPTKFTNPSPKNVTRTYEDYMRRRLDTGNIGLEASSLLLHELIEKIAQDEEKKKTNIINKFRELPAPARALIGGGVGAGIGALVSKGKYQKMPKGLKNKVQTLKDDLNDMRLLSSDNQRQSILKGLAVGTLAGTYSGKHGLSWKKEYEDEKK